jgi:dTDP-4-amino-4,6-dideoxygalactose transaminase
MPVPFARPDCQGNELKYVQEVLESGWLTTGAKAREFEQRFASWVGARHALAVNSCTAALHLACEAVGIGPGSRVIVPTVTFTATAEVVRYLGGEVVLADVDPETGLLTPEILHSLLRDNPDVTAVLPVHFAGRTARMRSDGSRLGIMDLCEEAGVRVIEDAAHAFPCRYECGEGEWVGGRPGSIACFSFYANKTITTGEGGMITTDDDDLAARISRMRLHGIDRDAWNRFTTDSLRWEYDVVAAGFKYNLPDLAAAIGLAQLERAEELRRRRAAIVDRYRARLDGTPNITMPPSVDEPQCHAWHLFCIRLETGPGLSRQRLMTSLHEDGIGTSVHYKPLHRMSYWSSVSRSDPADFPGAERWWAQTLSLPLFPSMTAEDVDEVCDSLIRHLPNAAAAVV